MENPIRGKNLLFIVVTYLLFSISPLVLSAQSTEIQQLILNVEKLSQFKAILKEMKAGYDIVNNGYSAIRNIAKGNFSLHAVFMDGLMLVSPEVKKYGRLIDIINMQGRINSEYRSAFSHFQNSGVLHIKELEYLENVYGKLLSKSKDNLDDLLLVITSGQLRMSDDERLQQIDRIYFEMQDKLLFLRNFNQSGNILLEQRKKEINDLNGVRQFFKKQQS